eukprot:TRINITY_DN2852_c0_g2_i1.p1 TRINITY_DN2852_c0_g2~~TRINITY_DN2852_c0_g2_i1.p1  ORF type:complete len:901 (+),score=372.28 TRINITY_DN2852_c0_g2_i1:102-2804(+)
MADKRKIQRLEEDLLEAENAKKKIEREKTRLERDLKELQEECENLRRQPTPSSGLQPKEVREFEKKISALQNETDSLREEVNKYKDEANELRRKQRDVKYEGVEHDAKSRQLERQLDELKATHDRALQEHQQEVRRLQAEAEAAPRKPSAASSSNNHPGRVGGIANRARPVPSPATADIDAQLLKAKIETLQKEIAQKDKQQQRELRDLQDKLKEEQTAKDRLEKRLRRLEDDVKESTARADKEGKAKWSAEQEKMRAQNELRDTLKLVDIGKEEIARQRALVTELESKARERSEVARDDKSSVTKLERDFSAFKKESQEERERERTREQRRIVSLESELNEWKARLGKTETSESTLSIDNRRLTNELRTVKSDYENYRTEAERDKRRAESTLESTKRGLQGDIDDLRAHVKKLKDKLSSDKRAEHSLSAPARALELSASQKALDEAQSQAEALQRDKLLERVKLLEAERMRLNDALLTTERDLNAKIAELKAKLKEKEQSFIDKKDQLTEQDKLREKEAATERKRFQDQELKRAQEVEELGNQLIDEKAAKRAVDDKLRKALDDLKSLEGLLGDEKEERKLDNERSAARLKHAQAELGALQSEQHEWAADARKLEQQLREAEDEAVKRRRAWEDTKIELDTCKFLLERTQQDSQKLELELRQQIAALEQKVPVLEKQLDQEMKEKVAQTKRAAALEQRVDQLEYYFLRPEDTITQQQDFSTPAVQLMKKLKSEQQAELDAMRKAHSHVSKDSLTDRFKASLNNIPAAQKEVMAYQITALMTTLDECGFGKDIQMRIATTLVENLVDAEIIRELRMVASLYLEREVLPMEVPEAVIKVAQRRVDEQKLQPDYLTKKRSEIVLFRDALLDLLAEMRASRMKSLPADACRDGILAETFAKAE